MFRFVLRRLLMMAPMVFIVLTVTFIMVQMAPGSPFSSQRRLPPEIEANLKAKYRFDQPKHVQYFRYVGRLLGFRYQRSMHRYIWYPYPDFGDSTKYKNRSVNDIIKEALPVSAFLGLVAYIFALIVGLAMGTFAAYKQSTWLDHLTNGLAMLGLAIPNFILGPLLVLLFSLSLYWLPPARLEWAFEWGYFRIPTFRTILLPVLTLSALYIAYIARLTRSGLIETLRQDYIRKARAKGLSEWRIITVHALRGAILPVVSFSGLALAFLITGTVVVERMFAIPGLGAYFIDAANNRDHFLILGLAAFGVIALMFANLAVDIAYATSIRGFDIGKRRSISRRHVLVPPLVLAGCATVSPYFGRTRVPGSQRLVHPNGEEPSSLDPAQSVGGNGDVIIAALLESLTALGPLTLEPAAALATHYNVDAHAIQYTFFLRGHPRPRGIRLRNTDSLNFEISGSRKAPSDRVPAFWSDGTPITAHDFVYSWRRLVDPAMAAPLAFYLEPLGNYKEIVKGARKPETLAVRALDDFTFQLELIVPISPFLKVLWQPLLAAVPRQSIEVARQSGSGVSWTAPGNYISSGPFLVARMEGQRPSRPHEESDVLGSSFGRDGGDRFPADLEWNN